MSLRKVPLLENEYYHIYNRGNSKQEIFLDDKDRDRFIKLLYLCNSVKKINFREDIVRSKIDAWDFERGEQLVSIGAYCLMPNHFHLYITSVMNSAKGIALGKGKEANNISTFIMKLCTAYTMYFNKKYSRSGSLFEGKFKSVHIEDENQAKYLFSYIHLNPVKLIESNWKENGISDKENVLKFLETYKWSSYRDFLKIIRNENKVIDIENFELDYFPDVESFKNNIIEWIGLEEEF